MQQDHIPAAAAVPESCSYAGKFRKFCHMSYIVPDLSVAVKPEIVYFLFPLARSFSRFSFRLISFQILN